ncbi:MAG TPA: hypothetical protein VGS06_44750, partial [Streptosporangiaceae bacterium]|nr:hypothetical protein [Streptosporangiaceae bacterium]
MAIALDSSGTTKVTAGATSATLDITSAAVGATVYAGLFLGATQTSTTLTGWTSRVEADESTATHYAVYRRVKQSGDTTFTWSWVTSTHGVIEWASYTGGDQSTFDELAQAQLHTTGTSFATPSLTPNGAGRWSLAFTYARDTTSSADLPDGSTWTPDAALTERLDASTAAGSSPWISAELADSNGTVTVAAHSYTATCATAESHGAAILLFLIPASSAGVAGTVQPRATVPVPRRRPGRALWQRITGQAFAQVPAPAQQPKPAPRRIPARAVIRFTPVTTTNAVPPPPVSGTIQPRATVPVPRRRLSRGFWRGIAVPGVYGTAPAQQYRTPPRRALSRAVIRFTPVTTVNAPPAATVVNQWAGTFAQPAAFQATPPALQSLVVALTPAASVGGGTGTPSSGNWLFCICGWNQKGLTAATVGDADDIHSFWRPGDVTRSQWAVSPSAGNTRTSVWYTANLARQPGDVYAAPSGAMAGMACLVIEVAGLGPWDTVTGIAANYAAGATSLNLTLPAPSAASFVLAAVCGDSSAAGQAFAPATWTTLATVTASNGSDHTCDAVLTSAVLPSTSSSVSVNGTASSATDLAGVILSVQ